MGKVITVGDRLKLPLPTYGGGLSTAESRERLERDAWNGVTCPCCGKLAIVRHRKLDRSMALFLARLVYHTTPARDWANSREFSPSGAKSSNDGSTLWHWDLLESHKRGIFRPTELGVSFINGDARVPKYAYLYNNELLGFSEEMLHVSEYQPWLFNAVKQGEQ